MFLLLIFNLSRICASLKLLCNIFVVVPTNEATAKEDAREIFIKGDTLDSEKVSKCL